MIGKWLLGAGAAGTVLGAYALYEPYRFRLGYHELPVGSGAPALTVLHISDFHLKATNRRKLAWLGGLADRLGETPDLVLATGDMIQDDSGIEPLVEVMASLEARLGRYYVLGSHDYYQSRFQPYTKYWTGRREEVKAPRAATLRMEELLADKGWMALSNRSEVIASPHGPIRVTGVDDPYLRRQRTGQIARARDEVLAIGLMHAPDVVSEWVLNGYDLALGGHTHAGQVRLPGIGALVTNCSLPLGLAGGPNRVGSTWLHISPGLGTGVFSPIRFNARPEVTLLRLVPAS
ncbi:MAG: metallophosphoesterase [Nitrososphaeraceae archaeon]